MATSDASTDRLVDMFQNTIVAMVRQDGPDLSSRQLGVLLICYLRNEGHTVRALAAELNVAKPVISRALDRLSVLGLAGRKVNPKDRRSIFVQRTSKGSAFIRRLRSIMNERPSGV